MELAADRRAARRLEAGRAPAVRPSEAPLKLRRHRPRTPTLRPAERYLTLGADEARRAHRPFVGTDDVLLALVRDPHGEPSRILGQLGVEGRAVERALAFRQPEAGAKIDPEALQTLGIDFDSVRSRLERTYGPGALERSRATCLGVAPDLKRALAHAVDFADGRTVDELHVLLGLLSVPEAAAARRLAREGVTLAEVRAVLDR